MTGENFSAVCYVAARLNIGFLQDFYGLGNQHWMILALPFMLLYNGRRGGEHKYFFYLYYPLHQFVIAATFELLRLAGQR